MDTFLSNAHWILAGLLLIAAGFTNFKFENKKAALTFVIFAAICAFSDFVPTSVEYAAYLLKWGSKVVLAQQTASILIAFVCAAGLLGLFPKWAQLDLTDIPGIGDKIPDRFLDAAIRFDFVFYAVVGAVAVKVMNVGSLNFLLGGYTMDGESVNSNFWIWGVLLLAYALAFGVRFAQNKSLAAQKLLDTILAIKPVYMAASAEIARLKAFPEPSDDTGKAALAEQIERQEKILDENIAVEIEFELKNDVVSYASRSWAFLILALGFATLALWGVVPKLVSVFTYVPKTHGFDFWFMPLLVTCSVAGLIVGIVSVLVMKPWDEMVLGRIIGLVSVSFLILLSTGNGWWVMGYEKVTSLGTPDTAEELVNAYDKLSDEEQDELIDLFAALRQPDTAEEVLAIMGKLSEDEREALINKLGHESEYTKAILGQMVAQGFALDRQHYIAKDIDKLFMGMSDVSKKFVIGKMVERGEVLDKAGLNCNKHVLTQGGMNLEGIDANSNAHYLVSCEGSSAIYPFDWKDGGMVLSSERIISVEAK